MMSKPIKHAAGEFCWCVVLMVMQYLRENVGKQLCYPAAVIGNLFILLKFLTDDCRLLVIKVLLMCY